jgi:hypothetical protein
MLLLEHWTPASHPDGAAFGSHNCASFCPHRAWHSDAAPRLSSRTQHTVLGGQFAAPLHLSADVSPPGHPASAALHEYATP